MLAPISDEDAQKVGQFARKLAARILLSAAGAVGAELGRKVVERLWGREDDDEDEE